MTDEFAEVRHLARVLGTRLAQQCTALFGDPPRRCERHDRHTGAPHGPSIVVAKMVAREILLRARGVIALDARSATD